MQTSLRSERKPVSHLPDGGNGNKDALRRAAGLRLYWGEIVPGTPEASDVVAFRLLRKVWKAPSRLARRSVNPTRVPIDETESIRWLENLRQSTELLGEAQRCVHIGDRESDIYDLFCTAEQRRSIGS
jgi:hypothetical protein